jgi:hypothetical protein
MRLCRETARKGSKRSWKSASLRLRVTSAARRPSFRGGSDFSNDLSIVIEERALSGFVFRCERPSDEVTSLILLWSQVRRRLMTALGRRQGTQQLGRGIARRRWKSLQAGIGGPCSHRTGCPTIGFIYHFVSEKKQMPPRRFPKLMAVSGCRRTSRRSTSVRCQLAL